MNCNLVTMWRRINDCSENPSLKIVVKSVAQRGCQNHKKTSPKKDWFQLWYFKRSACVMETDPFKFNLSYFGSLCECINPRSYK